MGDSYDNALAENIIGLYKAEVICARGPWRTHDAVEYATLEWVNWFINRRLLAVLLSIVSAPEPVLQRGFPQSAAGTMNRPGNSGRSGG